MRIACTWIDRAEEGIDWFPRRRLLGGGVPMLEVLLLIVVLC